MSETLVTTFSPDCECAGHPIAVAVTGKEGATVKVTCFTCGTDWKLLRAPLKAARPTEIGDKE